MEQFRLQSVGLKKPFVLKNKKVISFQLKRSLKQSFQKDSLPSSPPPLTRQSAGSNLNFLIKNMQTDECFRSSVGKRISVCVVGSDVGINQAEE